MDFTPQALLRIKVALLLREIAKQEKIVADQKRVDQELDALAARYEDAETKKQIYAPQYRVYMESVDRNRQIIDKLREAMIK
jgi:FKBP-type peptidyl-prolyl cis-trans isomerase (trigger factor)